MTRTLDLLIPCTVMHWRWNPVRYGKNRRWNGALKERKVVIWECNEHHHTKEAAEYCANSAKACDRGSLMWEHIHDQWDSVATGER
jgi:hypothetical protein